MADFAFESCFKVTSTFSTLTVLLKCIWVNANYMSTALQKELRHCPVWLPYINLLDQYQYLGNCPPTPPLIQQQSIENKLRLTLG